MFSRSSIVLITTTILLSGLFFIHSQYSDSIFGSDVGNATNGAQIVGSNDCYAEINATDDIGGLSQTGDKYFGNGAYDLSCARYAFSKSISINPRGDVRNWHQLGRIDFLEGKFGDAIKKFETQIEFFGDQLPNVYYMLGLTHGYSARESQNSEEWTKAEEAFKQYIDRDPDSPWPRIDLSWVYFAQGKYDEMEFHLLEGIKYAPQNPWLLNMYGLMLLNTDRKVEARHFFELSAIEAKKLTPEEWGRSYPGNDPKSYETGLRNMRDAIQKNLDLASK